MAPARNNPNMPNPMINTLSKVPRTANVTTAPKLPRKSLSYNEQAESRIIGGNNMLKNKVLVNLEKKSNISHGGQKEHRNRC